MRDVITAVLSGDTALAAILTGGIYAGSELNRQDFSGAFDANGEVEPCGLVSLQRADALAAGRVKRSLCSVVVFAPGQDDVYDALDRIYDLLCRYSSRTAGIWFCSWVSDQQDLRDQALGCWKGEGHYYVYHAE